MLPTCSGNNRRFKNKTELQNHTSCASGARVLICTLQAGSHKYNFSLAVLFLICSTMLRKFSIGINASRETFLLFFFQKFSTVFIRINFEHKCKKVLR